LAPEGLVVLPVDAGNMGLRLLNGLQGRSALRASHFWVAV